MTLTSTRIQPFHKRYATSPSITSKRILKYCPKQNNMQILSQGTTPDLTRKNHRKDYKKYNKNEEILNYDHCFFSDDLNTTRGSSLQNQNIIFQNRVYENITTKNENMNVEDGKTYNLYEKQFGFEFLDNTDMTYSMELTTPNLHKNYSYPSSISVASVVDDQESDSGSMAYKMQNLDIKSVGGVSDCDNFFQSNASTLPSLNRYMEDLITGKQKIGLDFYLGEDFAEQLFRQLT